MIFLTLNKCNKEGWGEGVAGAIEKRAFLLYRRYASDNTCTTVCSFARCLCVRGKEAKNWEREGELE